MAFGARAPSSECHLANRLLPQQPPPQQPASPHAAVAALLRAEAIALDRQ